MRALHRPAALLAGAVLVAGMLAAIGCAQVLGLGDLQSSSSDAGPRCFA